LQAAWRKYVTHPVVKPFTSAILLVTAALLPLHAHRAGSDCSLATEFGPSPSGTLSGYYGLG
jgi:hypothetical protein